MLKKLILSLCLAFSCFAFKATAADCTSPISSSVTLSATCTLGANGLIINSGGTLSNGSYQLTDSTTNSYLVNNGTLNLDGSYALTIDSSTMSEFTNNGTLNLNTISGSSYAIKVGTGGVITNFNNTGTMNMKGVYTIWIENGGSITNFTNSGTMQWTGSPFYGTRLDGGGSIDTFTNTGSIKGSPNAIFAFAGFTLGTLNNAQGSSNGALTYRGDLPTNYNIIISSPTYYGQLSVSAPNLSTNFGISQLSNSNIGVAGTRYLNVLTGLSASNITNENQVLTYTNGNLAATYSLVPNGASNAWDLLILSYRNGATATDTQASLTSLNSDLKGAFIGQTLATNFANMNTYDCDSFDAKGLCVSVGGRYTTVDGPSYESTSAVVVVGYKATPNIRIGGFLDQNINNNTTSSVRISNKSPLMGIFVVWNKNADGLGYQVKLANAYQDKNIRTTRKVIGTSEAGTGSTNLNTQSYVGELSYALMLNDKTLVRPYIALRHTTIQQDGYTEAANITSPLTYAPITDRSLTSLVGAKFKYALTSKVNLTGSLGVEHDLEHHVDQLTATGISGLTSENFNSNIKHTRAVATVGAQFSPARNQRIAGEIYYQQLPFRSTGSTTAYVNYTVGF